MSNPTKNNVGESQKSVPGPSEPPPSYNEAMYIPQTQEISASKPTAPNLDISGPSPSAPMLDAATAQPNQIGFANIHQPQPQPQPITYQPSTYQNSSYPPNAYPPNAYPPNAYPPNAYPTNVYPPNGYQPHGPNVHEPVKTYYIVDDRGVDNRRCNRRHDNDDGCCCCSESSCTQCLWCCLICQCVLDCIRVIAECSK